jgi:hypothetical protein
MGYYLFDEPLVVLVSAGILEGILLLCWLFSPRSARPIYLLAGPFLVGMVFLLDWTIETDREKLEQKTRDIIQAVENEDSESIIVALSGGFMAEGQVDRTAAASVIRHYLSRPFIKYNTIRTLETHEIEEHKGEVAVSLFSQIDPKSPYYYFPAISSECRFHFRYDEPKSDYLVTNIEILRINGEKPARSIWGKTY